MADRSSFPVDVPDALGEIDRASLDAKWAECDARREFHEWIMRDQALAERDRLCEVIETALSEFDCTGGKPWDEVARVAFDALKADGVVFAYIGTIEEDNGDGR